VARAEVRSLTAPLSLILARARRQPGRWAWPLVGLALATAFAGTVAGEGAIACDPRTLHGRR
jgi:hypothetical protein